MATRTAQPRKLVMWAQALSLMLVLAGPGAPSAAAQGEVEHKKVLILFQSDSSLPSQAILEQALRSNLKNGSATPVEVYSEYLDDGRTGMARYEKELVTLLRRKYEGKTFDVIFAVTQTPLRLLLRNQSELFPGTPIVFLTLDQRNLDELTLNPHVTGVWGEITFKPTLELALAFHPGTRRVVVITGVSDWDKYWLARAQEDFRPYESGLEFTYLTGLSSAELRQALGDLPAHTVVMFVTNVQDKAGNAYENRNLLDQIAPASTAPVYGNTDAQLGSGIVGGRLLSFEALGAEGAQVGLRVMAGEKPGAIAPHGITSASIFDWRALKRWGISESSLPPGSVIRFKELTFWERYRWHVTAALALIALQSALITVLLVERRRRRRAGEALDQLNAELEERIAARTAALAGKSRELETFAYSVAHDLKAPLRGIDGYSRLLLEDYAPRLDDEGRSFLTTIHTSAEEMSQLIDDLLDYSRLERREFKPDRLELRTLVDRLVEQKRRETAEDDIEFVVNVNGGTIVADASGLFQSLRNYLDNAVKFTRKVPEPRIEVGAKETADGCLLWVRDNGIGFDSKYHDQIFGIFQRLNPAEDYPGTGIGLAIVRKAAERMGGRAWAESAPGRGATFYLEIPKVNGGKTDS